jgi:hypothetical protein
VRVCGSLALLATHGHHPRTRQQWQADSLGVVLSNPSACLPRPNRPPRPSNESEPSDRVPTNLELEFDMPPDPANPFSLVALASLPVRRACRRRCQAPPDAPEGAAGRGRGHAKAAQLDLDQTGRQTRRRSLRTVSPSWRARVSLLRESLGIQMHGCAARGAGGRACELGREGNTAASRGSPFQRAALTARYTLARETTD